MCRSIKPLYNLAPPATEAEIEAAALQFVRKVSGFTRPSRMNEAAFAAAVAEIAGVSRRLLAELETSAEPRDRAELAEAARRRGERRAAERASG